jgi:ABC-type bacteriocin/lantibiotic exporter with double-glycine peptidase domain
MTDTPPQLNTARRGASSLILGLLRPAQRFKLSLLIGERVALGLFDLALAAALYLLFLQLQGGTPSHRFAWLPRSAQQTAWWTVVIVVLRLLADLFASYSITRFTQGLYCELLQRLVSGYNELRWNVFVQRNRSELVKHATVTAVDAAYSYQIYAELISGLIIVCFMAVSLVYQSLPIAVGLAVIITLLYGFHRFVLRDRLKASSAQREHSQRSLQRILSEIFSSAKEIRAYRNEEYFYERMRQVSGDLKTSNSQLALLPQVSRIIAEQGVVLLFLGIILVVLGRDGDVHRILSLLIFYFVVSRRMLPLISQLALLTGQLDGAYENLQIIYLELEVSGQHRAPSRPVNLPSTGSVLEMEGVTYVFQDGNRVLDDVSFRVGASETVLLRGVSGSGKSTLLNLIAGVAQADAGEVRVDREYAAYVPQEIVLLDDTVRKNLLFGLPAASDAELARALAVANLDSFIAALPRGLDTRVGDNGVLFSGGQRQRLGLARAVLRKPTLMLLDEATSALDPENEQQILQRLAASSTAVLLVTHRMHTAALADRTLVLHAGRLTQVLST